MMNHSEKLGTPITDLISAIETFDMKCLYKEDSTFEEIDKALKKGNPVVVDWFSPGISDDKQMPDGHYSIVVDLDKENIYLQDPEIGRMRTIPRDEFLRVWFDFEEIVENFIKNKNNIHLRQMIEISKK